MDTITIELFDLTVSQALIEVQRVLDTHPNSAISIVLDDEMQKRNVIKLLDKHGRSVNVYNQGQMLIIDVIALKRPTYLPPAVVIPVEPKLAPINPVLILSGSIGIGDPLMGRRLLLEVLKRADKHIPWIGIAYEGFSILKDTAGLKILRNLAASGVSVRVSKECMMFYAEEASGFEVMEDSEWQSLLIKGNVTKF
ncbi:MAG: hypothetical protein LBH03_06255 [Holophagales bacterium]|nr:hypothetical protein [Holophagales bacterium]